MHGFTAADLKVFFDANAILIIFAWGLVCKYVPFMARIPNAIIPWVGSVGYVLARLVFPAPAQAGALDTVLPMIPNVVGVAIAAFIQPVWARQLYEGFGRSLLEGLFGLKKPR